MFTIKRTAMRCFNNASGTAIFGSFVGAILIISAYLRLNAYVISHEKDELNFIAMQPSLFNSSVPSRFPLVREFKLIAKRFDNEDARVVGFPVKMSKAKDVSSQTKIIYLATTYFREWNPRHYYFFHLGKSTFSRYQCPVSDCYVTKNPSDVSKADAVIFHVRDLEIFSILQHRRPHQVWILYSMEPSWLEIKDMRRLNGLFNWTMSYRRNSDVLVKYGFIGRKPEISTEHVRKPLSSILKQKMNRAVWYVSNCNTNSKREDYIKRLKEVYPVDVAGGCGQEACRPAETKKCYDEIEKRYKFYLSFENAICQEYVTEKLYNPLEYYIIPVTFGGADYATLTPRNSIINAMEFESPEELGRYLWKVSQNETLYLSYFMWKKNYRSYLQPWMCDLCEKLHNPISHEVKYNLDSWWYEEKSCLKWTNSGFTPAEMNTFPRYHTKLFG